MEQFDIPDDIILEETDIYKLIQKGTKTSLKQAWRQMSKITDVDVKRRGKDRGTLLHTVVNQAPEVYKKYQDLSPLIPLIYRLALKGSYVNAMNEHGNTVLHISCIRPNAQALAPHLIRIGLDPCLMNKKQCRVIHTYQGHKCTLVKGQQGAKSGIWNAVEKEDITMLEKLLKSWCRINVKRNKSLKSLADETANIYSVRLLTKFEYTNELACAAFACDVDRCRELLKQGKADLNQKDEAFEVPKPLVVAVGELGDIAKPVVEVLKKFGAPDAKDYEGTRSIYEEKIKNMENAFEESEFYMLVAGGSTEQLEAALDLILKKKVDIRLTSYREHTKGQTYLHFVVNSYVKMKEEDEEKARLLIRAIYRLALAGIDVNARDAVGETALVKAAANLDQNLLTHCIRIGCDSSISDDKGSAVNEEVYEDKGKLVFDRKYRIADLPGLWVAVQNNEIGKAERWLKSWARVSTQKGDRRLIDIARALKRKDIVRLLEEYDQINEFVCATFACDKKRMMDILAMGKGANKVNTIDELFHVGFTWDRHAEFMPRPIIITAMELCTPEVVDFLLNFGADLSKDHEECSPCGPVAFWAFRDHVSNENALVVAKHADVELMDEFGATMLHKIIQKNRQELKTDVVEVLLDREIDLAARDHVGSTAYDYITLYDVPDGDVIRQVIDNYVLELVNNDQPYKLETLLLNTYDHVLDVRGTKKNKSARAIAELKEYQEIVELLDDWQDYRGECDLLHESAKKGDISTVSKLAGEKRCATCKDKGGRTLLHNAVLFEHTELVTFLTDQFPNLINERDNLGRTPLHLCVCLKERQKIWPILQDGGADPNLIDVNNMSVYDYVRELETPTLTKEKPRGRRDQDYRPSQAIDIERNKDYGCLAERREVARLVKRAIGNGQSLQELKPLVEGFHGDITVDDLDIDLLKMCIENKRGNIAKFLIATLKCRVDVEFEGVDSRGEAKTYTVKRYADKFGLTELVAYIKNPKKDGEASRPQTEGGVTNGETTEGGLTGEGVAEQTDTAEGQVPEGEAETAEEAQEEQTQEQQSVEE